MEAFGRNQWMIFACSTLLVATTYDICKLIHECTTRQNILLWTTLIVHKINSRTMTAHSLVGERGYGMGNDQAGAVVWEKIQNSKTQE